MTNATFRMVPDTEGMTPSDFTDPDTFTTRDTTERNRFKFATEDESTLVGFWECAPCREKIDAYPVHEMMTVVSGSVTLTHPDGSGETFTAGDTFFVEKGSKMIWEITETLRKHYMIVA